MSTQTELLERQVSQGLSLVFRDAQLIGPRDSVLFEFQSLRRGKAEPVSIRWPSRTETESQMMSTVKLELVVISPKPHAPPPWRTGANEDAIDPRKQPSRAARQRKKFKQRAKRKEDKA